ncbi:trans-2,3-dihydro-3-hydroxyanthranilate isomerase [Devosia subaequoris]|uniref:Trans-2,3-dihydro-3-hydroxyanthranilate isomerase n=1 Tax=Devosia subaequoris TaxID=395930 RepID=A0A7W6IL37_9HYPH|nr:PhzF family phenazine biosynthesis protein [Devosia subaequoris]MBB4051559.1 trans-2,3-dihydro-3-hydroxyanthranilate isomerase [Devosia subaequoris]MCP1209151.1 PhzF family phenazine biosynthesis protein [Devosia subaequoris]
MNLPYLILDVFTRTPLKGNALAVVPKADGLMDNEMQAIAREFNLSETVFICKPQNERNSACLRIFTPYQELPFAGHPTVGAAVTLGLNSRASAIRMEEKVGLVTALFDRIDRRTGEARFTLPRLPERIAELPEKLAIAQALGIEVEEIGCDVFRPAVFSAGVTFHLVPVRNATVLKRIALNRTAWNEVFHHDHHSAYVFTLTPEEKENDIAARMFGMGLGEDPGTGSAAAALIGLLAEQAMGTGQTEYILRQGHEMGRPCRITLQLRKENDALVHGAIGGEAVVVGEGELDF